MLAHSLKMAPLALHNLKPFVYSALIMPTMVRETWTDERLDRLNGRVEEGFTRMDDEFQRVDQRLREIDVRLERIDDRFEQVNERFDVVNERLVGSRLASST